MDFLEKDIQELASRKSYFEPFENASVLITGATGLLGSILAKSLIAYSQKNNANITVYACCRNREKYERIFGDCRCSSLKPVFGDVGQLDISSLHIDWIVHGASITDSRTFIERPVETIETAFDGTRNLLRQCVGKELKGFVYLSSLEVYGAFNDCDGIKNVLESDGGYIDTMSVRSSYSEGKRMAETLCSSYAAEYSIPVKVARLCQTFGAGVEYGDSRVFAQFARAVIEKSDIVLRTKGETVRNYCYTTDAVRGILTVLSKGRAGEAYNIANSNATASIANMARLVCTLFPESGTNVVFDIAEDAGKLGYNPLVRMRLDSGKLESLGWKSEVPFDEMFRRLVGWMREIQKK